MKTLVLASHKGGVGKSAVATLLSHFLLQCKKRVLAIDLDHQGHFGARLRRSVDLALAPVTSDALMTGVDQDFALSRFTLVPGDHRLLELERQPQMHARFSSQLQAFLASVDPQFDVCVIDTSSAPDVRLVAALGAADFVLSPIQLAGAAMDAVSSLFGNERAGVRAIRKVNPKLQVLGLLPSMVDVTPFQRSNFAQLIEQHSRLLIPCGTARGDYAFIPRRSAIARAQMSGGVLWRLQAAEARQAWHDIEASVVRIAAMVTAGARP